MSVSLRSAAQREHAQARVSARHAAPNPNPTTQGAGDPPACHQGSPEAHPGSAHGSFLIRAQRGHLGVVLPLFISNSVNH